MSPFLCCEYVLQLKFFMRFFVVTLKTICISFDQIWSAFSLAFVFDHYDLYKGGTTEILMETCVEEQEILIFGKV